MHLEIPEGGVGVAPHVGAHFEPEGRNEIQHHGRPQGEAGGVDKVQPDGAGRDVHALTQPGTNPEGLLLHEVFHLVQALIHTRVGLCTGKSNDKNRSLFGFYVLF